MDKRKMDLNYLTQLVRKAAQFDMIRDYVSNADYPTVNAIRAMLGMKEAKDDEK